MRDQPLREGPHCRFTKEPKRLASSVPQKLRWSRVRQIEGPTPIHRAARGPRISLSGKLPSRDQGRGRASSIIQIAARPLDRSSRVGRAGIQRLSTVPEQPGTGAADEVPAAANGANRQLERVVIHRCHVSSSTPLSTTIHGYTQVFGLSSLGAKDREGTQVASHYLFLNCRAQAMPAVPNYPLRCIKLDPRHRAEPGVT